MKKFKVLFIIVFAVSLLIGTSITAFADANVGFNVTAVRQIDDVIQVNGWIINVGNTTVSNFRNIILDVFDANDNYVISGTFNDINLYSKVLKPGEGLNWTFNIHGAKPGIDISKWRINSGYDFTNIETNRLDGGIKVFYNGKRLNFPVSPRIQDGRTLVPMRAIFEAMGADVQWNDTTKTVIATRGNMTIKLKINDSTANVNDTTITLDTAAIIDNGSTLVPLRFISEAMGCTVQWGQDDQIISILE